MSALGSRMSVSFRCRVIGRQHLAEHRPLLPLRHGRRMTLAGRIHRRLHRRHRVDIARAVRKDRLDAHAHDELGAGELREERIVLVHRGSPVDAEALRALEVDEEQADLRVDEEIAEALEHAVAIVARKRQRLRTHHADEAGPPDLVRALRAAFRVGGGEEEHGPRLDEGPVGVAEDAVHDLLDHPIGEPARLEAVLEPSRSVMVHGHLGHRYLLPYLSVAITLSSSYLNAWAASLTLE